MKIKDLSMNHNAWLNETKLSKDLTEAYYDRNDYYDARQGGEYGKGMTYTRSGSSSVRGYDRDDALKGQTKHLPADPFNRTTGEIPDKSNKGKVHSTAHPDEMDESTEGSPVASAITRRILLQRHDLLSKYGPAAVTQAIDDVADFVGDVEEIGSSDVSGWIKHVEQSLAGMGESVAEADEWEEQGDRWNRFQKWAVNQMLKATDKILTGNHVSQLENQYFGHPIQSGVQQTGFGSVDDGRKFTKFVQSIWDNWEEHRTQAAASNASDMLSAEGQQFLKRAYDDFMGMGEHSLQNREQHAIALSGYQVEHFNGKLFGTLGGNIRGNRASMTPEIWGILEKAEADLAQKNIIDYDEKRMQEELTFWKALPAPVRVAIAAAMGKTPGQLEAILFNVKKEEPQVQGESAVQAKTDDKLLAYYAQRKAEKEKQQGTSRGGQVYGQPEWKKPRVPSPTFTPGRPLPKSLQQKLGNMGENVAESSPRVDSLVTDALKIMQGAELNDAVQALKTVIGDREYNSRRGFYGFYVKQLVDMYGQQGMGESANEFRDEYNSFKGQ